jgi:RNA polymerase sigma factor (sigma-70 family)
MPPNLVSLRQGDGPAWALAYPSLWEAGMIIARLRLAGGRFERDRQDLVSTAIQQLIRGLMEEKNESYNRISTWDDCLSMTRHIVRQRITDFFRSLERSREDAVEELPELPEDFQPEQRFRLKELLPELDRLQPDPPVPQVFRERFIERLSTDEIAERRGINRNTLLTYFAKGLRTLRERLTRLEGDLS